MKYPTPIGYGMGKHGFVLSLPLILIVVALGAIALFSGGFGLLGIGFFDGIIYDDYLDDSIETNCNSITRNGGVWTAEECTNGKTLTLGNVPDTQNGQLIFSQGTRGRQGAARGVTKYSTTKTGVGFLGNNLEFRMSYEFLQMAGNGAPLPTGSSNSNSRAGGTISLYIQDSLVNLPVHQYECQGVQCGANRVHNNKIELMYDDPTDLSKAIVEVNGEEQRIFIDPNKPVQVKIEIEAIRGNRGVLVKLNPIEYTLRFNCEVESDETVIVDRFIAINNDVEITIDDLKHKADLRNFCLERPVILADINIQGQTIDVRGTLIKKLEKQESITIQPGQVIEIPYVIDFNNQVEACPIDSAFSPELNRCYQYVEPQEDIITIIRDVEFITIGENSHLAETPFMIGDKQITISTPRYTCNGDDDHNAPNPSNDCWEADLSLDGNVFSIKYGEEKLVLPSILITYLPEAHFESEHKTVDSYTNRVKVSILDRDFITTAVTSPSSSLDYFILPDEDRIMQVTLNNNLATFNAAQSGYKLVTSGTLVRNERIELMPKSLLEGQTVVTIPIPTDELGEIDIFVQFYVDIGGRRYFDDTINIQNNEVVTEIPKDVIIETVDREVIVDRFVDREVFIDREVIVEKPIIQSIKYFFTKLLDIFR